MKITVAFVILIVALSVSVEIDSDSFQVFSFALHSLNQLKFIRIIVFGRLLELRQERQESLESVDPNHPSHAFARASVPMESSHIVHC